MDKWQKYFLDIAHRTAKMSKDPSTKVGAVLVGPDRQIVSTGYNGFPRGIDDSDERLNTRETKYALVVHAEMNSLLNAGRYGIKTGGTTLYVVAHDSTTGQCWGGPPCIRCAVEAIQAGVSEIVVPNPDGVPARWLDSLAQGRAIIEEAGIKYTECGNFQP